MNYVLITWQILLWILLVPFLLSLNWEKQENFFKHLIHYIFTSCNQTHSKKSFISHWCFLLLQMVTVVICLHCCDTHRIYLGFSFHLRYCFCSECFVNPQVIFISTCFMWVKIYLITFLSKEIVQVTTSHCNCFALCGSRLIGFWNTPNLEVRIPKVFSTTTRALDNLLLKSCQARFKNFWE